MARIIAPILTFARHFNNGHFGGSGVCKKSVFLGVGKGRLCKPRHLKIAMNGIGQVWDFIHRFRL